MKVSFNGNNGVADITDINNALVSSLTDGTQEGQKRAGQVITDFTRTEVRKELIIDKVLPIENIGKAQLNPDIDPMNLRVLVDKTINSGTAFTVPLGTSTSSQWDGFGRYPVAIQRIATKTYYFDVAEAYTYSLDIREQRTYHIRKDLEQEIDVKAFRMLDVIAAMPSATQQSWDLLASGGTTGKEYVSREDLQNALRNGPKLLTGATIKRVVTNTDMVFDIQSWGFDEMGGDLAGSIATDGLVQRKMFGVDFVFTSKSNIVPIGKMYMFADPEYLGKFYMLTEPVVNVKVERGTNVEMFGRTECGISIGNRWGFGVINFTNK